jgi:hypothetical protein
MLRECQGRRKPSKAAADDRHIHGQSTRKWRFDWGWRDSEAISGGAAKGLHCGVTIIPFSFKKNDNFH